MQTLAAGLRWRAGAVVAAALGTALLGGKRVEAQPQSEPLPLATLPQPAQTLPEALTALSLRAQAIFAGQVIAVQLPPDPRAAQPATQQATLPRTWQHPLRLLPLLGDRPMARRGIVQVVFRVDEVLKAVPGLEAGGTWTLQEWSGLWSGGTPRYSVGERAVLFLQGASAAGLATPVNDMEGVLPISGFAGGEPLLDTLRQRSALQRRMGAPIAEASGGPLRLGELRAVVKAACGQQQQPQPPAPQPPAPQPLTPRPSSPRDQPIIGTDATVDSPGTAAAPKPDAERRAPATTPREVADVQ